MNFWTFITECISTKVLGSRFVAVLSGFLVALFKFDRVIGFAEKRLRIYGVIITSVNSYELIFQFIVVCAIIAVLCLIH